jgi:uncharacterized protein HemX
MATVDRQHYALQTIFSFFLGLMVLAFIGVGVNTFYQSPEERLQPQRTKIERQMDAINTKTDNRSLTATEQAQMDTLTTQQNRLQDEVDADMKTWARNTSIVLVIFATLVLVISLIRSDQLRVLSNGLLLGGLFTMLYGTGWVIFSGNSVARFVVIAFALLVAIGLGYVKFVRQRASRVTAESPASAQGSTPADESAAYAELVSRVAALEERASAAASALGGGHPSTPQ